MYSIINVSERNGNLVSGVWLQDCSGTLEEALSLARDTERANSNRIEVAVVDRINGIQNYDPQKDLREITL